MTTFGCLLLTVIVLLCGFAVVTLIDGSHRRPISEIIGLAIVLGTGTLGTPLIWASMIGARPTRLIVLAIGFCAAVLVMLCAVLRGIGRPILPQFRRPVRNDLLLLVPLLPIIGAFLIVAMIGLRFDLFEADSIYIWGFKAKSLFVEPLKPAPPAFMDAGLSFTHQDYPLLLPMLTAATYSMMGAINEAAGRIVFVLLFIGQALLAFAAVRRWLPVFGALVVTAFLMTLPFAVIFFAVGNPDSAIETFYLGALIYLIRWIELPRRADLIICALMCAFMATSKSEGLPLATIHAAVLLGIILMKRNQSRAWLDLAIFVAIVAGISGIWWIWRAGLPHTVEHYESRLTYFVSNLSRLKIIIPTLAIEAATVSNWGVFWGILLLAGIVGYKALSMIQARVLWTLLILHLCLYMFVYVIAPWDVQSLLDVSRNRLALHIAPAGMLLIALHWSTIQPILPAAE